MTSKDLQPVSASPAQAPSFQSRLPVLETETPGVSCHLLFNNHIQHWDIPLSLWVSLSAFWYFIQGMVEDGNLSRKDPAHPIAGPKGKADFWNGPGVQQI